MRDPNEVQYYKVPRWLVKQIRLWCRQHRVKVNRYDIIQTFAESVEWHIDHWGRCGEIFVNEPYERPGDIEANHRVASILGIEFAQAPVSHHNPGNCRRFEFRQP